MCFDLCNLFIEKSFTCCSIVILRIDHFMVLIYSAMQLMVCPCVTAGCDVDFSSFHM